MIKKGSWVLLHRVVLPAGERAPAVPADTRVSPLRMWVKGVLLADAHLGDCAEALTQSGRRVRGELLKVNPAFLPGFGSFVPELRLISEQTRALTFADCVHLPAGGADE